jgi:hypothetical protein
MPGLNGFRYGSPLSGRTRPVHSSLPARGEGFAGLLLSANGCPRTLDIARCTHAASRHTGWTLRRTVRRAGAWYGSLHRRDRRTHAPLAIRVPRPLHRCGHSSRLYGVTRLAGGRRERLEAPCHALLCGFGSGARNRNRCRVLRTPGRSPIEFPPLANYTVGDAITHIAIHNTHHLGQIIILRQMLGAWPPPASIYTW